MLLTPFKKQPKYFLYGGAFFNRSLEGNESVWGTSASDCRGGVFHHTLIKVTIQPQRALLLVIVLISGGEKKGKVWHNKQITFRVTTVPKIFINTQYQYILYFIGAVSREIPFS